MARKRNRGGETAISRNLSIVTGGRHRASTIGATSAGCFNALDFLVVLAFSLFGLALSAALLPPFGTVPADLVYAGYVVLL